MPRLVTRRVPTRHPGLPLAVLALVAVRAFAQPAPAGRDDAAAETLTLDAAQQLALQAQPLLEAQTATIEARRERAVSARQLPDPKLMTGVSELPVNTGDAWSLSRDGDTDVMVGFVQEFPRAAKRRLRGEAAGWQADEAESALRDLERRIRRDAGLAFLDAHHAERIAALEERLARESELQRQAVELRVRSGLASQAELLAIAVETGLVRDRVAEQRQMSARARRQLARWIGEDAQRPLELAHGAGSEVASLEGLLAALSEHPAILVAARTADAARAQVELARASYRPDWSLEVGYGYRPEFSEMLTVRATVDLPLFRRNRQDREVAAARRELAAAEAQREDRLRELGAELAALYEDWRRYDARAEAFAREVVPQARARVEAATEAWRAGRGSLAESLSARRALLEVERQALDLAFEREHRRVELAYFATQGV